MTPPLSSSSEHEQNVISWLVQNPQEFWALSDRIGENVFKTSPWDKLWPILLKGWQDYQAFPTLQELGSLVARLQLDPMQRLQYGYHLRQAYANKVTDYTGSEIVNWVALQELTLLGKRLSEADYSKFDLRSQLDFYKERLDKIEMLCGEKSIGELSNPLEDLENWWEDVEESYGADPITTGIVRLDRKLRDRGIRPILVLIVGPTGVGKTTIAKQMIMANVRLGGRWLEIYLDDSKGEFKQRTVQSIGKRYLRAEDYEPGKREALGKILVKEAHKNFPGQIRALRVHPDKYGPQDFIRAVQELQRRFKMEDEKVLSKGGALPWETPGKITGVSIDTGNQVTGPKAVANNNPWYSMEKMMSGLRVLPELVKAPLVVTIQAEDGAVGASQVTLRNIGVSRGMARPAKLILGVAQTVQQSQCSETVNWNEECWQNNKGNLWNVNFQTDRETMWEPVSLCIAKNTAGSGDKEAGLTKNVMIPLLISYATSRVIENWAAPDELMRTDSRTAREQKEAYGKDAGEKQPENVEGKRGKK